MSTLLNYASYSMFRMFYTHNVQRNIGVKGITWLVIPNIMMPTIFLPEYLGGYNKIRIFDSFLLYICVGFSIFASFISCSVIRNIYNGTSEPDKLKNKKA